MLLDCYPKRFYDESDDCVDCNDCDDCDDCNGCDDDCDSGCAKSKAVYAGVVTQTAQTVGNRAAVQFVPPILELNEVDFNGTDLFTIVVPGNYFCIAFISPAADQEGPVAAIIGLNGPGFGLSGANYGTAAGQQVVCFGFTGEIPAGSTLGLYNVSGRSINLGPVPARLAITRV